MNSCPIEPTCRLPSVAWDVEDAPVARLRKLSSKEFVLYYTKLMATPQQVDNTNASGNPGGSNDDDVQEIGIFCSPRSARKQGGYSKYELVALSDSDSEIEDSFILGSRESASPSLSPISLSDVHSPHGSSSFRSNFRQSSSSKGVKRKFSVSSVQSRYKKALKSQISAASTSEPDAQEPLLRNGHFKSKYPAVYEPYCPSSSGSSVCEFSPSQDIEGRSPQAICQPDDSKSQQSQQSTFHCERSRRQEALPLPPPRISGLEVDVVSQFLAGVELKDCPKHRYFGANDPDHPYNLARKYDESAWIINDPETVLPKSKRKPLYSPFDCSTINLLAFPEPLATSSETGVNNASAV